MAEVAAEPSGAASPSARLDTASPAAEPTADAAASFDRRRLLAASSAAAAAATEAAAAATV